MIDFICKVNETKRYMKKKRRKMLLVAIIGIIMVISGLSDVTLGEEEQLSNLMLENVEALASGEGATTAFCYGEGSVPCPDGTKVEFVGYLR